MALDQQIETDLRNAMKSRETEVVATLRMALAAIRKARVAPDRQADLTDVETVELLTREAKKRSEAAEAFAQAGRDDAAEKERRELVILQRYLPRQLDDDELARIVDEAVATTGASSPGDLGKVMSAVMPQVRGRGDGRRVNALVRERLS